jgi:hypothetical protein
METSMSTRQNMRRELQDLAKLAQTMPKERPTPMPTPAKAFERPSIPSRDSVSVPPAIASVPVSVPAVSAVAQPKRGRGLLVTLAAAGIAVAIVVGGAMGRTLAQRSAPAAAAKPPAVAAVAPVAPPVDPTPTAPAAQPEPVVTAAPTVTAVPKAVAVTNPPAATPRAVNVAAAHAASTKPAAKPSLVANVPASTGGGKGSLEDAIRAAVAKSK